ncbi:AAA family ATPase [Staphylococcus simulans]|uniref:AAA family ATPase n=1 Tax=Staphylococcus simulans TaxID=1286 RepID=UPI003364FF0F
MIEKLENENHKSFRNYTSNDKFTNINIFFGKNGSGKTSLTEIIAKKSEENNRVFDTTFVRDNVEAYEEIDGVKLIVGKEQIDNEKLIKNIKSENDEISTTKQMINEFLNDAKRRLSTIIHNEFKNSKENFKTGNKIKHKKNTEFEPDKAYKLWLKDIDKRFEFSQFDSLKSLEERKENKEKDLNTITPVLSWSKTKFLELEKTLSEDIIKPSENLNHKLSSWIEEGIEIHRLEDGNLSTCKFCGSDINPIKLLEDLNSKLNDEYTLMMNILHNSKKTLEESIEKTQELSEFIGFEVRNKHISTCESLIRKIEEKEKNSQNVIYLEKSLWSVINKCNGLVNRKEKEIKETIENINSSIFEIEKVAKSWIGQQLSKNEEAKNEVKLIEDYTNQLKENDKRKIKNNKRIEEIKSVNSDLAPFKKLVEEIFQGLGINVKLVINENEQNYSLKHSETDEGLSVVDLSEGERRLIAFLHFYYNLFVSVDDKIKDEIKYILIDDPITSLDIDNRYFITQIINDFIVKIIQKNRQLFLFTHSSLDFHNYGYSQKNNKKNVSYWRIAKNDFGNSELEKLTADEMKNFSNYYNDTLKELLDFALKGRQKLSEITNHIQYANKARFILESHARTHYRIENITTNALERVMENYEISKEYEDKVIQMLSIINSLSHGVSLLDAPINGISIKSVQDSIRVLIGILYKKDKYHIASICNESSIGKDQWRNIQQWSDGLS